VHLLYRIQDQTTTMPTLVWLYLTTWLYYRTSASCVALADALETVCSDRLKRRLQSDWSGQRLVVRERPYRLRSLTFAPVTRILDRWALAAPDLLDPRGATVNTTHEPPNTDVHRAIDAMPRDFFRVSVVPSVR
jgi:hypothetical protein